jgi:2-polyprenyl-3-methyl-5-hydroxy-6-metoxy-1,4-benzoquinol methylase
MSFDTLSIKKVLVVIASYGTANDKYLARLIEEYRSMDFALDIIVVSNKNKSLAPGVEVIVGLPDKDPWSLPFAHKPIFARKSNNYDLFIYTEDDILITEKNIRAFIDTTTVQPENEIAGFLRSEIGENGKIYYPDVHGSEHWDPQSVRTRDGYTFAFFTNEHSGCYILTRPQLQRAIDSGGFLVGPHQGRYGLPETAATDPYTQCSLRKMICISHLEDFTVPHLSRKYVGRLGLAAAEFDRQVESLLKIGRNGCRPFPLFDTVTKLPATRFSKHYYEPEKTELLALIPEGVQSVLSLGCGWGATEQWMSRKGIHVVAVPLDSVISACADARGVEVVSGDFRTVGEKLKGRKFNCLLMSNMLHLVKNPSEVLHIFRDLVQSESVAIALVPNLFRLSVILGRIQGNEDFRNLGNYGKSGVHLTSHQIVTNWFKDAGFKVDKIVDLLPERAQIAHKLTLGLMDPLLASEFIVVARKA